MPSLELRDRPRRFTDAATGHWNLGNAFQEHRWLVILGDPGSGKSTLLRWIAGRLARALLNGETSVRVPARQFDPNPSSGIQEADLGPARIPVLVRIADFAEARQREPTLLLADYLGRHPWLAEVPTFGANHAKRGERIPPDELNQAIKASLREKRVVVLLDGLDEITASALREDVVRAVETFVGDWIDSPTGSSLFDAISPLTRRQIDSPAMNGGNQIVVTSRIAGYHAAPLRGRFRLTTIEPMGDSAISHFCDVWSLAVYRNLAQSGEPDRVTMDQAAANAASLKEAINATDRPGIRELAANPLLLTVLAIIHHNTASRLPAERERLYEIAVETLVDARRSPDLKPDEVMYVMAPLAVHIHHNYPTGLIEATEAKQIVTRHLAEYRAQEIGPAFSAQVDTFFDSLHEQVGLLTARGEQLYGFLHLTFQEYLVARYLVRDPASAPAEIVARMRDPRWREPIMLALGYLNRTSPSTEARERVLRTLLDDEGEHDLVPLATLLVADALGELVHPPPRVVDEVIGRLVGVLAERDGRGRFTVLRDHVTQTLQRLSQRDLQRTINDTLVQVIDNTRDLKLVQAVAEVALDYGWQSPALASRLLEWLPLDDGQRYWPITRALRAMAAEDPPSIHDDDVPLRAILFRPDLLAEVRRSSWWPAVLMTVYGAVDDDGRFATSRIHRDSPLTTVFLAALERGDDRRTVQAAVERRLAESADPTTGCDGLLALLALHPDPAAVAADAVASGIGEAVLDQLSGVHYWLAAIISNVGPMAAAIAGGLVDSVDDTTRSEVFDCLFRIGQEHYRAEGHLDYLLGALSDVADPAVWETTSQPVIQWARNLPLSAQPSAGAGNEFKTASPAAAVFCALVPLVGEQGAELWREAMKAVVATEARAEELRETVELGDGWQHLEAALAAVAPLLGRHHELVEQTLEFVARLPLQAGPYLSPRLSGWRHLEGLVDGDRHRQQMEQALDDLSALPLTVQLAAVSAAEPILAGHLPWWSKVTENVAVLPTTPPATVGSIMSSSSGWSSLIASGDATQFSAWWSEASIDLVVLQTDDSVWGYPFIGPQTGAANLTTIIDVVSRYEDSLIQVVCLAALLPDVDGAARSQCLERLLDAFDSSSSIHLRGALGDQVLGMLLPAAMEQAPIRIAEAALNVGAEHDLGEYDYLFERLSLLRPFANDEVRRHVEQLIEFLPVSEQRRFYPDLSDSVRTVARCAFAVDGDEGSLATILAEIDQLDDPLPETLLCRLPTETLWRHCLSRVGTDHEHGTRQLVAMLEAAGDWSELRWLALDKQRAAGGSVASLSAVSRWLGEHDQLRHQAIACFADWRQFTSGLPALGDLLRRLGRSPNRPSLWADTVSPETRSVSLAAIGRADDQRDFWDTSVREDGLTALDAVLEVLDQGAVDDALLLFSPLITRLSEPGSDRALRTRSDRLVALLNHPDRRVGDHAAVVWARAGAIDTRVVTRLVEVMGSTDTRLRAEITQVFRDYLGARASAIGPEALQALGLAATDPAHPVEVRTTFLGHLAGIEFDDGDHYLELVARAATTDSPDPVAAAIVNAASMFSPAVVERIGADLELAKPRTRQLLLRALARALGWGWGDELLAETVIALTEPEAVPATRIAAARLLGAYRDGPARQLVLAALWNLMTADEGEIRLTSARSWAWVMSSSTEAERSEEMPDDLASLPEDARAVALVVSHLGSRPDRWSYSTSDDDDPLLLKKLFTELGLDERRPEDVGRALDVLLAAGADEETSQERESDRLLLVRAAYDLVEADAELCAEICHRYVRAEHRPGFRERRFLLALLVAIGENMPATYEREARAARLEPALLRATREVESSDVRRLALAALSHLRTLTPEIATALTALGRDVPEVQEEARDACARFRQTTPEMLRSLVTRVTSDDPADGYLASQLIQAITRGTSWNSDDTAQILADLTAILDDPVLDREVFTANDGAQNLGTVRDAVYDVIFRLSGGAQTVS